MSTVTKIALEGPINKCTDSECLDWRRKVIMELGVVKYDYHNPMDFDCRGNERNLETVLIAFDTQGITSSDIVLVMANKAGWGTAMAVQMAWAMHKTIITVCPDENPSPWLRNRSTMLVKTLEEALAFIKRNY